MSLNLEDIKENVFTHQCQRKMARFGLRIKQYIVSCINHLQDANEYGSAVLRDGLLMSNTYVAYNCDADNLMDKELSEATYLGFSCINILLHVHCKCRNQILQNILSAMKLNLNIRYKSKVVLATYKVDIAKINLLQRNSILDIFRQGSQLGFERNRHQIDITTYPCSAGELENSCKIDINDQSLGVDTGDFMADLSVWVDITTFHQIGLDSAMLLQCFVRNENERMDESVFLNYVALADITRPIQRTLQESLVISGFYRLLQTSANAEFYFFSINPALAIIINNYYFSNLADVREGSEQDVRRIIRELKIAGIPYIIIQDGQRRTLQKIIEYFEKLDCSPLKSFLFFLMTHGKSDNIVKTADDKLDFRRDIVNRIVSNPSLKDAKITMVLNACRGGIYPQYADYFDLDSIKYSDGQDNELPPNVALMYSVPDGVTSLRCTKHGSPFIMSLCKHIRRHNDWRKITELIDRDLRQDINFDGLEKVPEFLTCDPNREHCIFKELSKACNVLKLIVKIVHDFKEMGIIDPFTSDDRKAKNLFFISGVWKIIYSPLKVSFTEQYLANDLDEDSSPMDNEDCLEICKKVCLPSHNDEE